MATKKSMYNNTGASKTSQENGRVGGEITKRLVQNGMNQLGSGYTTK